ncbi:MAG: acyl-ACP--UDP-N-acetylglucosamine O-acyltransferase, partial [Vicinamibacteria bacterium]
VPARAVGLNVLGLKRAGVGEDDVRALKRAYRLLYRSRLAAQDALLSIEGLGNDFTQRLAHFLRSSERGVCRERRR